MDVGVWSSTGLWDPPGGLGRLGGILEKSGRVFGGMLVYSGCGSSEVYRFVRPSGGSWKVGGGGGGGLWRTRGSCFGVVGLQWMWVFGGQGQVLNL